MGGLFQVFLVKTSIMDLVVRMGPARSRAVGGVTPSSRGSVTPFQLEFFGLLYGLSCPTQNTAQHHPPNFRVVLRRTKETRIVEKFGR